MNFHQTARTVPASEPLDALLADFVAGRLKGALAVLVAAHLQMTARDRDFVDGLAVAGGILLDGLTPAPLSRHADRLAAILDGPAPDPAAVVTAAAAAETEDLPPVLRHWLGRGLEDLDWAALLPGVETCTVASSADGEASLIRCRAGRRLERAGHGGPEAVLVLQGGYGDASGHYLRGDLALVDAAVDHRPVCDPNESCLLFVVRQPLPLAVETAVAATQRLAS